MTDDEGLKGADPTKDRQWEGSKMVRTIVTMVCSSTVSLLVTLVTLSVSQPPQAAATPGTQQFDFIRVRGIEVVDLENKRVVFIGNDAMNSVSGVWIGGPRLESQQIELLVSGLPGQSGTRPVGIIVRDDISAVRDDPAVRGGHAGGPILWQAP